MNFSPYLLIARLKIGASSSFFNPKSGHVREIKLLKQPGSKKRSRAMITRRGSNFQ